ncbi:unnamed protein product [Zymoseptoria tritici ST99CH_3D7]|uniref:Uncharacterized protein n=1 Tax=Zymoseptoria tritici (strain ST99CH_3D7) TaxID=1276538 RepID=A0A1X7REF0_ZYMT9|nr:unnamed protein product [Zymoseptoria tritici ST99CH_3D7]
MGGSSKTNASIQAYLTPSTSPIKGNGTTPDQQSHIGDGFTNEEIREALNPAPVDSWHPTVEYADCEISDLYAGPRAVTFMGRVANIFDCSNTPKTPRSAKGCLKLCVKDGGAAITIRLWFATQAPRIQLGSLVSIWTNHVSNGENGNLASMTAPLFSSLFPERDRNCHFMIHENSDDGRYRTPLGYRQGVPLNGLMTLQNFIDGGYDVADAKILVVVKSIGARKKITRKDESTTDNMNLQVHDDTAEATLGLWGTSSLTTHGNQSKSTDVVDPTMSTQKWRAGETVLLIQSPGWKFGRSTYLSFTSSTIVDVDPYIPDADWLRRWSIRQKVREAINPPFPENVFEPEIVKTGPIRCLFSIADLDEFARCAPGEIFQGYMSVLIMEMKLLECWKRNMLLSGECCSIPIHVNAMSATCKGCEKEVDLRLSPRIMGQVIDETATIAGGKLLFSDGAWRDLLGRGPEDLLKLSNEEIKYLSDRLLFSRVTLSFGWTGDESKAGGRICIFGVRS